jgi:hypothetical protein
VSAPLDSCKVWVLWHKRTKSIVQRDVDNRGFEAYSYVPGLVLDSELSEDQALVDLVGRTSGGGVNRGTLVAFPAPPGWYPMQGGCIRPKHRRWGTKFSVLSDCMHADAAEIVMEYLSCGPCSYTVRDSQVEGKLSAREMKDKTMKKELEALITGPEDPADVITHIRDFFAADEGQHTPPETTTQTLT